MRKLADILHKIEGKPAPEWLSYRTTSAPRPLFAVATPSPVSQGLDVTLVAQQIDEARAAAELEGLKAAQEKVDTLCERYLDGIAHLAEVAKQGRRPAAADLVALAMVIAREILQRELTIDRERVVETVDRALQGVQGEPELTLRMGRADLAYVTQRRPDLVEAGIRFIEDDSIGVGGCEIESLSSITDATLENRLKAVARAVSEVLATEPAEQGLTC